MENGVGQLWKTDEESFRKLSILSLYDPAVELGVYLHELKRCVHTRSCTQMFIAALFIVVTIWNQAQWPPIAEWINKLWYIHPMGHYSVIKNK